MNEELKVIISANIDKMKTALKEATNETQKYASESEKSSNRVKEAFSKIGGGIKKAGEVVAGATVAIGAGIATVSASLAKGISDTADYGDNIDKMSQKIGISAEAYQEWDFIMQHCGASIDGMQAGMKTLSTQAEKGSDAFERLGISQEEIAAMSQEELFGATISALQGMEEGTERTAIASQLLGKNATELGALLNMSAEDTEAMKTQLHEMGGVMSNEGVKNSAKFKDSLQNLKTAIGGAKNTIMADFLPSVTGITDGLTDLFSGNSDKGIGKINSGITGFIKKITDNLPKATKAVTDIVKNILSTITQNLPQILECGLEIVQGIADGIMDNIGSVIEAILGVVTAIVERLPDFVTTIANKLPELLPQLIQGVLALVITLCNNFSRIIDPIIEVLPDVITNVVDTLIDNLPALIDGVISLVLGIVGAVDKILEKLLPIIPTIIARVVKAIIANIPKVLAGVLQVVGSVASTVGTAVSGIWEGIKNVFSKAGTWFYEKVVSPIVDKFNILKEKVCGVWDSIKDYAKTPLNGIIGLINGLVGAVEDAVNWMVGGINGLSFDLPDILGGKHIGFDLSTVSFGRIPELAKGGIIDKPTLALTGENGKEAVVPLENNLGWLDRLADLIAQKNTDMNIKVVMDSDSLFNSVNKTQYNTQRRLGGAY